MHTIWKSAFLPFNYVLQALDMLVSIELLQWFLMTIYYSILIVYHNFFNEPLAVGYVVAIIHYGKQHQNECVYTFSACPVISLELVHALRNVYVGLLSHQQDLWRPISHNLKNW